MILRKFIAAILVFSLLSLLLCSCFGPKSTVSSTSNDSSASLDSTTTSTGAKPEPLDPVKAKATLEKFLTADDLHLKILVTYVTYIPSPVDPKRFELWSRGLNYRSNEFEGDSIKFVIIVKGNDAKQYSVASQNIIDPLSTAQNYTDYYKWDFSKADTGQISSDGSYIIFTIDNINKFYKKDTAKSGYYYTKVEFGVTSQTVLYTTLYGNSSTGDRPTGLNAVTQTYESVNINEKFSDSVFEAPF